MILLKNCWGGVKQQSLFPEVVYVSCFVFQVSIKNKTIRIGKLIWFYDTSHPTTNQFMIIQLMPLSTIVAVSFIYLEQLYLLREPWENHLPVVNDKHLRKCTPLLWQNQVLNVCGNKLWSSTVIGSRPWHDGWLHQTAIQTKALQSNMNFIHPKSSNQNKAFYILVAVFWLVGFYFSVWVHMSYSKKAFYDRKLPQWPLMMQLNYFKKNNNNNLINFFRRRKLKNTWRQRLVLWTVQLGRDT